MEENQIKCGTVEKYSNDDFKIWNDIIEETPKTFWIDQIQYNQNLVHSNSCFLHWPAGAISDLLWYKWKTDELKTMVDYCWKQEWADPEWW